MLPSQYHQPCKLARGAPSGGEGFGALFIGGGMPQENYLAAQQAAMFQLHRGQCLRTHPPEDVEKHAIERLQYLKKRIPELRDELAEMAVEQSRLTKMLEAVGNYNG